MAEGKHRSVLSRQQTGIDFPSEKTTFVDGWPHCTHSPASAVSESRTRLAPAHAFAFASARQCACSRAASMSLSLPAEAAPRRSGRERQEPVRLQSEQEGEALSRDEAADVEAPLLLSLQEGEAAAPDDVALAAAPSDEERSDDDEEEKEGAPAAAAEWHIPAVLREPPRMARRVAVGAPMRLPEQISRRSLLQLFLTPALLESWAQLTNAAAGAAWQPTDSHELLAFVGAHLYR